MGHASRRLARQVRQAYSSASLMYNDNIIRGPSRLQLPQAPRRDYYTDERRLINPAFEVGRSHIVGNFSHDVDEEISENEERNRIEIEKSIKVVEFSLRHKYEGYKDLKRLLDKGAIVEAMTRFKIAYNESKTARHDSEQMGKSGFEITPHIIDDIIHHLSRIARSPRKGWNDWIQITSRSSHWSPGIISHKEVKSVHVNHLSYFALMDVYEIGSSLGFMPSTGALSSAISAISHFANEKEFPYYITEILFRCSGKSYKEAQIIMMTFNATILNQLDFKGVPLEIICAIVEGYGKLRQSDRGEQLLARWCTSNQLSKSRSGMTPHAKILKNWAIAIDKNNQASELLQLDSSSFADKAEVWTSLIRSREASSDLAGARYWLQRYRREGLAYCKNFDAKTCHKPHVAYLLACTRMRLFDIKGEAEAVELKADTWIAGGLSRFEAVQEIVKSMNEDGTIIPTGLIILLLKFYIGYGRLDFAQKLRNLLDKRTLGKSMLSRYYIAIFHLHRKEHLRGVAIGDIHSQKDVEPSCISQLRKDFLSLLAIPDHWWISWSAAHRREVLNQALRASLIAKDLPMASRVLRAFRDRHILIDERTETAIMASLEPETLEALKKRERRQYHQANLHENLINLLKAMATDEMPFEQYNFVSKPRNPVKIQTPIHRLDRLMENVNSWMLRLVDQERRSVKYKKDGMNWINDANRLIRGRGITTRKGKLHVLLAPFPHRRGTSMRKEQENATTSDAVSAEKNSNESAEMERFPVQINKSFAIPNHVDEAIMSPKHVEDLLTLSESEDLPLSINVH